MQDVGQNGPENEVNPLIDNGMMYTTDGWGTVYKIDIANPDQGKFVWIADAAVRHEGNSPRTRGIALWEDRVVANLPDGRVIAIDRDTACSPSCEHRSSASDWQHPTNSHVHRPLEMPVRP